MRQREIVHFQRFGEALRGVQDKLATRKFYMDSNNTMFVNNQNNMDNTNNCGCGR